MIRRCRRNWFSNRSLAAAASRKRSSNPEVWGGQATDPDPVLPFRDLRKLALAAPAADRVVYYSEGLGGPRIGEIFGLELRDLQLDGGWAPQPIG